VVRWDSEPVDVKLETLHSTFAHKAMSNNLYYLANLKFAGENADQEIRDAMKKFKSIHVPLYLDYFKTRDNLMLALHAIGDDVGALECAIETRTELRALAESRARRELKDEEAAVFLTEREKPAFESAVQILSGVPFHKK